MGLSNSALDQIRHELDALNDKWSDAGKCYYFNTDPPHVLFNVNCPEELQERVRDILYKYTGNREGHTPYD